MKVVRSCQNFVTVSWSFFEGCGGEKYRLRDASRDFIIRSPTDFMDVMDFARVLRRTYASGLHIVVSDGERSFSI